jgi:cysteine synthase
MAQKASDLARRHDWFLCRQFSNEANAEVHARTTAQEIVSDFAGRRLDWFVTGTGTGGTLKGVARTLKAARPQVRIAVCEPDNAPVLQSGITQTEGDDGLPRESHPMFRPHVMQGWSPDFIPKLTADAVAAGHVDRMLGINGRDAMRLARELAVREGIFCGISAGATLSGALQVAADAEPGTAILFMAPDTGERYLSTPLFEDVSETMSEEEEAIARSTDGFCIGVDAPAATPVPVARPNEQGLAAVESILTDPARPVALFALEWCEFCWSLRRFFRSAGIAYHSVDLDAVAYQPADLGGAIRLALRQRIGSPTILQVFVAGTLVGGATETLEAWGNGHLQRLLVRHGVSFDPAAAPAPTQFLPKWVHPRRPQTTAHAPTEG